MPKESNPVTEAKRLAARGDFDPPANTDDCVRCEGRNGGVPGNENMIDGDPVCDYCAAQSEADRLSYNQKVSETVARLKASRVRARVRVTRSDLTTYLHILADGDHNAYTTFVIPLIHMDFPEAYMVSSKFTPEPWASDPCMNITISLDPKEENTMKTVYQTRDHKIFDNPATASDHEKSVFEDWLKAVIDGTVQVELADVLCHFKGTAKLFCPASERESYETPWASLKGIMKTYWDRENPTVSKDHRGLFT